MIIRELLEGDIISFPNHSPPEKIIGDHAFLWSAVSQDGNVLQAAIPLNKARQIALMRSAMTGTPVVVKARFERRNYKQNTVKTPSGEWILGRWYE